MLAHSCWSRGRASPLSPVNEAILAQDDLQLPSSVASDLNSGKTNFIFNVLVTVSFTNHATFPSRWLPFSMWSIYIYFSKILPCPVPLMVSFLVAQGSHLFFTVMFLLPFYLEKREKCMCPGRHSAEK